VYLCNRLDKQTMSVKATENVPTTHYNTQFPP